MSRLKKFLLEMKIKELPKSVTNNAGSEPEVWENLICLNSDKEPSFEIIRPAKDHYESDERKLEWLDLDYQSALERDIFPLPIPSDREGYYGPDHFSYWASGLRDAILLQEAATQYNVKINSYLDLGCASGRVLRHFAVQWPHIQTIGCDINRLHVEWCNTYLPQNALVFQNHSIPSLPLPDSSVDAVSAYSVFTHIEGLETAWLMEIRRILRPGGIAWITLHSEFTLQEMDESWPLWSPTMGHPKASGLIDENRHFEGDRLVMRWLSGRSYSSNVFYKLDYIKRHWGRYFTINDVRRRCPSFQDVVILMKDRE